MFHKDLFQKITSEENLFISWQEFRNGKKKKNDVLDFEKNLEFNLFHLHKKLISNAYRHSHYTSFKICDPKPRHIYKAVVCDRIVHHAVYRILYPIFNQSFIYDSYSCRLEKGTHKAIDRLDYFTRKATKNFRIKSYFLKCDIAKFFDSINHQILYRLIQKKIKNSKTLELIWEIIASYSTNRIQRQTERERVEEVCRLEI